MNIVKSLTVISSNSSLQLAGLVSVQISYSNLRHQQNVCFVVKFYKTLIMLVKPGIM